MQYWEYRTVYLQSRTASWPTNKGWRVAAINEQEQPNWRKSETYPSLAEFCNQMGQQHWEMISVAYPGRSPFEIVLYLKRPLQRNMVGGERIQCWEYRTVYILALAANWLKSKGWRIREINEREQPDWKKSEVYASVAKFCDQMDQQNWELVGVTHPSRVQFEVVLYLKRPIQ
jgi:hypothetical protein